MKAKYQCFAFVNTFSKLWLILTFVVLFLGSCKKPGKEEPEPESAVNVVNGIIAMPPIAFFIGRSRIQGEPLKYTEESGYFITFPGKREFDVLAEGMTDYILKTNFAFKENTNHTIFLVGESSSVSGFFTDDDLSDPPVGKAKIRFANLTPDGGNLVLSLKNGTVLFPDQMFKTASAFITIDPGVIDLQVKTSSGTVLTEKNVTVTAGTIYTAWTKGLKGGTANSPLGLQFRSINQ